ncbi:MAG: hypothetical protein J0M18_08085 [Ignavibacteria bacterium]|jgi:hypothetical protein|nr:hypothetical protein [Ignavibacteria bacterium]
MINCVFIADDLPVIFFSNLNPFPIATYWENGIQQLIPSVQIDSIHYRPLTSFFTYACFVVFGLKPVYWAIMSQVIHLANFILLILVLSEIQKILKVKNPWLCLGVPAFYLLYPGNVTNLAWLSARTDLIVILFCLSSFFFSLKYIQSKKFYLLILSSFLFLLGTLTKENAVSWLIVEFMLIWQIYFLANKSPEIFTSLTRLLNAKVTACIIYIFGRSILAMIDSKSIIANLKLFTIVPAYFKSLLFTFLPVDSGTFIYTFIDSKVIFVILSGVYFAALLIIVYYLRPQKYFSQMLFIGFTISLSTLSFYIIAGGGTYRLFALTFLSLLIFFFNLLIQRERLSNKVPLKIASVIVFFFFIFGSSKISGYWLANYKLQNESLESLTKIYDKDKENVILSYPHALGQSYCYSDIGVYLYYKVNENIGRFNNIKGLAALTSHNAEHYLNGSITEQNNNSFILNSQFNDTYFSSEPFFTEKSVLGERYNNLKNYSFEVVKLNSFSKPVSIKLQPVSEFTKNINYIKFTDGKFIKF